MAYKDPEKRRAYQRQSYQINKERERTRQRLSRAIITQGIHEWLREYLKDHPCIDCGETNTILLEFDHQGDKKFGIANAARTRVTIASLAAEVAKCHVRCANCHRRKTYKERGHTHRG
jgi:hypothetical protein